MSEKFDPQPLVEVQPPNPIGIIVPSLYERKQRARDIEDLGLTNQIVAIHPGMAIAGMRFRKLYAMEMDPYLLPIPIDEYFRWFDNEVRPRLDKNGEVVDSTCLGRSAKLLQHIIETDVELPL